ncbi:MAG: peptide chain release factor N(5)-glutamine methyltransferase [bacterium]|nr:peptide chain release factor N(5)-glutamine methyltransferase [bacterium]
MPLTVRKAFQSAANHLNRIDSSSATLDAELILRHATQKSSAALWREPQAKLNQASEQEFMQLLQRRIQGEPIAYLTGQKEFYGRMFRVSPSVLIPRPDSEALIELTLKRISRHSPARIADIGTGSGCLIATLLSERPSVRGWAVDLSGDALSVARTNLQRFGLLNRCSLVAGDLLSPLKSEELDLIVANLPYLTPEEIHQEESIHHEPRLALDGGLNGLSLFSRFLRELRQRQDRPAVLLEIDPRRTRQFQELSKTILPDWLVSFSRDLSGRERLAELRYSPSTISDSV